MNALPPAVHRSIICIDVEKFGDRRRTNSHQVLVRKELYRSVRHAFDQAGLPWQDCYHEDRGDGMLVLVPPEVPKQVLVADVPRNLAAALAAYNPSQSTETRIRLRLAFHAGEIQHDEHGVVGSAINLAFRLLEAEPLKRALADSPGMLAVVASQWFYEEVIQNMQAGTSARYRQARVVIKETDTIAWICLPDDLGRPGKTVASASPAFTTVPRQLPKAIGGFAGRHAELDTLTDLLEQTREAGGTVVISAIEGTAGIGKTAIAVHWAHQVADQFPDGQLYLNLRGFDPTGSPMMPAEAVRGFLDALGVPPDRIPLSLDGQAALYRSLLAGRRMLVMLDNARDAQQVRPLLPGSPGCMVVVTSRNRLTSLVTEGAHPITVDLLTVAEAHQLLARRIGHERLATEPAAAEKIIAHCARLPLALSIVAARAATHPTFALSALAAELAHNRGRLDAFDDTEVTADMRAVFSWSYQQLSLEAKRLFRLLGLHPGPHLAVAAAASLAGLSLSRARSMLTELSRAHLVDELAPGRFAFHDLLSAYAAEQADIHDPEAERSAALYRLLDYYLHAALAAAIDLHLRVEPIEVSPSAHGVAPAQSWRGAEVPDDTTDGQDTDIVPCHAAAWAWFEDEHPVLVAVAQLAAAAGYVTHAWQLAWTLMEYFDRWGYWHDLVATQEVALAAALRQGEMLGQAHAHRGLGRAYLRLGHYEKAYGHLQQALDLFTELGDRAAQAHARIDLSWMLSQHGRLDEAIRNVQQALDLSEEADSSLARARALNNSGWYNALAGKPRQALVDCQQAHSLYRELNDPRGEAYALFFLGYAYHQLGEHERAIAHYHESLALKRSLSDRYRQAMAYDHLGDAYRATGDADAACTAWQNALEILAHLGAADSAGHGYPNANVIRAKIREVDAARTSAGSVLAAE